MLNCLLYTAPIINSAHTERDTLPVATMTEIYPPRSLPEAVASYVRTALMLSVSLGPMLFVIIQRTVGPKHPLGWPLVQEVVCAFFRSILEKGNLRDWRQCLFIIGKLDQYPDLHTQWVETGACKSMWMRLKDSTKERFPQPTKSFVLLHFHGMVGSTQSATL